MQAAIGVFGKGSFQNSSISEIALRANVAEGTIYQYFSVFKLTFDHLSRQWGHHTEGALADASLTSDCPEA